MELRRTAIVKLTVPDERRDDLKCTMNTFRDAAQQFVNRGWEGEDDDGYVITSRSHLQRLVYDEIRADTDLHSDLCVGAANHAADALSTCVEKMKEGERTSKPTFTSNTTVYNTNAISYFDGYCSLAAYGNGRVHAEYVYPEDSIQAEYMNGNEWEKKGAKLRYDSREDTYYLHVTVVQEREQQEKAENQSVLGVDTNVVGYLAVTSTGAFIGNADRLNHERREYEHRRARLQQQGTRSAHLTIQSIGDRFARWSEDFLHRASKRLVAEAVKHGCATIAFEKLDGIRDRMSDASKFQQWAFRELRRQTEYKAQAEGITVETVNPAYTSQRCSHTECGFTHEVNRDGDEFCCQKCRKELHSDYNAARNIAHKYLQNRLKSGSGGATHHLALKSGTVNGNGDYSPSTV